MNEKGKRALAEKLVELTVREPSITISSQSSDIVNTSRKEIRDRYFNEQVQLRMKYFDYEQLLALLSFYQTEMGKSILTSQNKLLDDHQS